MALVVLFHRFTFVVLMILLLMPSKTCLLMIPISDLLRLISLQVGLLLKYGLTWSKQQERKRAEKETPLGTTPHGTQM